MNLLRKRGTKISELIGVISLFEDPLNEIKGASSTKEAVELLGELLGGSVRISEQTAARAVEEPLFAKALLASRNMPAVLESLLAGRLGPPSPTRTVRKAMNAAVKWGSAGMRPASPWVIKKRLAACRSCEFEEPAPRTVVYKGLAIATGKNSKICTLCGCLTNTKAALATENCPAVAADNSKLSRWGDLWLPPED